MAEIRIRAKTGTYIGKAEDGIKEFLGIRYAEPVGFWEMPRELHTTEDDIIEAKEYGAACIQPEDPGELSSLGDTSNDCLTLNIWTKENDIKNKPVMLYIHGGSYTNGGNNDPITYGGNILKALSNPEDAVIININYRLNIFGSMDLSVLDGYNNENDDSFALHIIDQIAALKWVNENIEFFDGDPDNVTLFGQSAGSMSIAYLMANDEARHYFNRGIMESGVPFFGLATKEAKSAMSKEIFDMLSIKSVDDLRSKDDEFWKENIDKIFAEYAGVICPRAIDGKYITEDFFHDIENGKAKDISLMVGGTTGEMDMYKYDMMDLSHTNNADDVLNMLYAMYEPCGNSVGQITPLGNDKILEDYIAKGDDKLKRAINIFNAYATQLGSIYYAEAQSKWNNTYHYAWNWMPDATKLSKSGQRASFSPWGRALHCAELPVLFNSGDVAYPALGAWWVFYLGEDKVDAISKDIVPEELVMKTIMTWYSFAKTGDPNNYLIPDWQPYNTDERPTMFMDYEWELKSDALLEDADILRKIKPSKIQDDTLKNTRASAMNVHSMER